MSSPVLIAVAPAKVNLYLEVGKVRPDGYHDVVTVLQALTLHDTLTIIPSDRLEVVCTPDLGIRPEDNLVFRAACALADEAAQLPHVRIEVNKVIPTGAGLGGGSSDAAAVLLGLATLWGIAADDPVLVKVAAKLGSDVPFFLSGGTALYKGRGDVCVARYPTPELDIAVVKPKESISTGAAYAAFDLRGTSAIACPEAMQAACESNDPLRVAAALHNDFTDVSAGMVSEIADALAWCAAAKGVLGVALAGSGSATFAVCADAESAHMVADEARQKGWWAVATRTTGSGVCVHHMQREQL